MLNGFNLSKLVLLPTLILRIQMPVILSFIIMVSTQGVRRTPNQTDNDVSCSRSCDQGKITKKD